MTRSKVLIAPILLVLLLSSSVCAQEPFSWVGKKVVTKYQYPVKVGDRVVDDGYQHIYTVARVNGDWLWVTWQSIEGWLPASQVVPFDQAIDFYTQEIRANPSNSAAWGRRAWIWDEKTEYDIAIADYNEAIRLDPTDYREYHNRGNAWNHKKDFDKAIADYNEAIRLDPKCITAHIGRGNAWNHKKEFDKAIADYNEAIRLDPKYAMTYSNRGYAWNGKKEFDKAIADCNDAIRLDPKYAMAYHNRGVAWSHKQDCDKAIADYNEAIRLDPTFVLPISNRAWLWATCPQSKFRDGTKAVESATRACELSEWKEANSIDTLAAAYAEVGVFDKAVEFQEKANRLYTDAEDRRKGEERLRLYKDKKPYRDEG